MISGEENKQFTFASAQTFFRPEHAEKTLYNFQDKKWKKKNRQPYPGRNFRILAISVDESGLFTA